MEETSIFIDKAIKPTDKDLVENLGVTYNLWKHIHDFVLVKYPKGLAEWSHSGQKYGWNFRIKDKKEQ